ncbi:hypothetical protein Ahy_B01g051923 [Arachis hypogaea]|uniref:Aminotransferase-like plant mobile domain-containing protein n=1 Tax=Arachis hypogaea TaxID=3818 RepID=A0A445AN60_ARAHY|nr:hypothetical protein Ahy_B01g051923 [Arachis hypogaea]
MGAEGTPVTDDEHVAFLFYWLNATVFCSRSVQMTKFFLPLAALLHEGHTLNLAKLLLAHVFEELDFYNENLNFTPFLRRNCGPAWLDHLLFPHDTEENELVNRNWTNLLAVQVIPTGLPQHKKEKFKVTLYAPHFTARQLGFSQAIPTPFHRNSKPRCHITLTSQSDLDFLLATNQQHKEYFNFLVYDRSSYITKSCLEWWTAYYSRYNHTLEEIQQFAIRTAPAAQGSPKKSQKRKADTAASSQQPQHKSYNCNHQEKALMELIKPSGTFLLLPLNKRIQLIQTLLTTAAHSITSLVAPDQPLLQQHLDLGHSTSMIQSKLRGLLNHYKLLFRLPLEHRVLETPQGFSSPPQQAEFQTPPGQESGHLGTSTTPTNATLANPISVLNRVIQEDEVPAPVPTLSRPPSFSPLLELDVDTREQLRSLLKLLDHPPVAWIKDTLLNQLLSDLLNSTFEFPASTPYSAIIQKFKQLANNSVAFQNKLQEIENEETKIKTEVDNCASALQPKKASREEFNLRISHAISIQAFYDKEEVRLKTELDQINEKFTKVRERRAEIAAPLTTAQ